MAHPHVQGFIRSSAQLLDDLSGSRGFRQALSRAAFSATPNAGLALIGSVPGPACGGWRVSCLFAARISGRQRSSSAAVTPFTTVRPGPAAHDALRLICLAVSRLRRTPNGFGDGILLASLERAWASFIFGSQGGCRLLAGHRQIAAQPRDDSSAQRGGKIICRSGCAMA
jgi:hypothetical protein